MEDGRRTLGDTHPNTLNSINNFAMLLEAQRKLSEAELLYREAVSGAKNTLGVEHPNTVIFQQNLDLLLQIWETSRMTAPVWCTIFAATRPCTRLVRCFRVIFTF